MANNIKYKYARCNSKKYLTFTYGKVYIIQSLVKGSFSSMLLNNSNRPMFVSIEDFTLIPEYRSDFLFKKGDNS